MHPFPPASELPAFVGDCIVQVRLNPWSVGFVFESGLYLQAEQGFEHAEPNGALHIHDCDAANGPPILVQRLLYRPIVRFERADLRLTLHTDEGSWLALISALGAYESGMITGPDGRMVVF